ncbi:hypothetical protein NIES4106_10380 [Fischerella sp. NIES-4106]|nr:hypothetical protein NIES4106_10380 [Fischerella sp. NIES-4106]
MKPNIIVYERSRGDNYNRQTLRMETTVGENDDPIVVLDLLRATVNAELGIPNDDLKEEYKKLVDKKREIEREVDNLNCQLAQAKEFWERAKTFFQKQGLTLPPDDDIPF